jgi:hypothetical protein
MDDIGYLGVFVTLVGAALAGWGAISYRAARASESWTVTPGRITANDIRYQAAGAGKSRYAHFVPIVRYAYSVNSSEHEGGTLRYGMAGTRTREEAEAILTPYPVGSETSVRYDPLHPERSVLEAGLAGSGAMIVASLIIGALLIAFGASIVVRAMQGI